MNNLQTDAKGRAKKVRLYGNTGKYVSKANGFEGPYITYRRGPFRDARDSQLFFELNASAN